jgi:hypothetical protein
LSVGLQETYKKTQIQIADWCDNVGVMEVWAEKINKCVMIYLDGWFRFSAGAQHIQTSPGVHVVYFPEGVGSCFFVRKVVWS